MSTTRPGHRLAILNARHPDLNARLGAQVVAFVQSLRKEELEKKPGVAEMLDFAAALAGLGVADLSATPPSCRPPSPRF